MEKNVAKLFSKLTQGVYVIGVHHAGQNRVFTASWLMQVSFNPLMVALSINPKHRSYTLLKLGGGFTVNVLSSDQKNIAFHCARVIENKLDGLSWHESALRAPILNDALAWLECKVCDELIAGDHHLITAMVTAGSILNDTVKPLLYLDTENMDGAADLFPETYKAT